VLAVLGCLARPGGASLRLQDQGRGLDLTLFGYGVLQTNLPSERPALFTTQDGAATDFTNRQVLNLRLEGQLARLLGLDARLFYDRENVRDWRYYLRLGSELSNVAFGELEGAFADTHFTRYDTPFYGLEGRLGLGAVAVSGFVTGRAGNYRVDRLRGSNLSGPYLLTSSPVLDSSERVAIEVRDRRDPGRVLSSEFQARGRDYTIDYGTGTIYFEVPVASETFDSNPVLVVVEYQFLSEATADDYLGGVRLLARPRRGLELGATWLGATGASSPVLGRTGLLGFDQRMAAGRWLTWDGEMAGPGGNFLDRDRGGIRLAVGSRPHRRLDLGGRYRRVGADFDVAANPRLESERDREEWTVDASFLAGAGHRLKAAYGEELQGLDGGSDSRRTRTLFAGWEARMERLPLLAVGFERRLGDDGETRSRLDTWTVDVEDDLGRWKLLGPTSVKAQYRLEDDHDMGEASGSRRSHTLKLRLASEPRRGLGTYLEWRESRSRGEGSTEVHSTGRELVAGGRFDLGRALSAVASLRWRRSEDQARVASATTSTTSVLDLRYEPSERVRVVLKYEWNLSATASAGQSRRRNLFAHFQVVPLHGLTLAGGYQLDDRGEGDGGDGGLDGEYFLSALYRPAERFTLFARAERGRNEERLEPFPATVSERDVWLVGSSLDLTPRWRVLGQIKDERLRGAASSYRRAIVLELSRSLGRVLRLAAGVELGVSEGGESDPLDRQRVYLKLIGTL
jgi:hypothetical protein